ncbi:phosphoglucosamine mutase [Gordonia sp. HY002]|uniref:phosphoglucosamine mutase n=1 Tax=Gordonia zhenghanii TaxID=2911516 RepID=UPI001EEFB8C2|nr:phosphoglucosamine mutase [Gordonia zhenghanii]MCF8570423.1 phosphoglucosamine mutase [Gordonia zhenghanii]MCF8607504.1 phosphoglucosamine mutase [Gordonia zhenghanii]
MARLFGTDGVRGRANDQLTAELALRLASAAVSVLGAHANSRSTDAAQARPRVVVGRDPRASGELLESALCAGLAAAGADAIRVGVVPTPAVAFLTADYNADFGVMISASHNPMPDNGIKFFAAGGHKLADHVEDAIEAVMDASVPRPTGAGVGRLHDAPDAEARYLSHLARSVDGSLEGLTIVVDGANGAASTVGPHAYEAAGATVIAINCDPDGLNINDRCGSTHLDVLQAAVLEHGADFGLAHDGDADRCLAVDSTGAVVDGDKIMAILALDMHERGELTDGVLVATVMSNLGLHIAMRHAGIEMKVTGVGDRYVLEELRKGGYALGGEQSGHIVIPAAGTTGDGVLTGLRLGARVASTGKRLADLANVVTVLPQELINVPVSDKHAVSSASAVRDAVSIAERELNGSGRILLRPSGTEQLVRVMVEAGTPEDARGIAERVAAVVADI